MFIYLIYFSIVLFLLCRLTCGWCYNKVCLQGKTAIITGGNAGIGYQAALALASRGCRVIIADKDDATESVKRIISETNNSNIVAKHLDLASFASVRKFAKEINETEPRLDILVNNAGTIATSLKYTEDGLQRTMQVNYFGHFLLTHLLLDLLKKTSPSRIIFASSSAALITKLNLEDMNPPKNFTQCHRTYSNSKLCQAIAAKCLAEKLRGTGVTAYSYHPGGVRSGLFWKAIKEELSPWAMIIGGWIKVFGKSTEEGAQNILYLATDKAVEHHNGKYFTDCKPFYYPYQMYDDKFCEDVWKKSLEYAKLSSNVLVDNNKY